ncbi:MAG: hypothetical protein LBG26_03000 [Treponema sp.]|jgi:hypothetical protein|nr:hypothetical protein [Treponema sp.]
MPMPKQLEGKAVSIMNQPNRGKGAGRKPRLVRKWIKACNIEKEDARNMLLNLLGGHTMAELKELEKSEYDQVSVLTYGFIRQAIAAVGKNDFSVFRQMLEFIYGKDEQPIRIKDDAGLVDLKDLLIERCEESPEERERIIAGLEKITGNTE